MRRLARLGELGFCTYGRYTSIIQVFHFTTSRIYCSPLLLGAGNVQANKIEHAISDPII